MLVAAKLNHSERCWKTIQMTAARLSSQFRVAAGVVAGRTKGLCAAECVLK